MEPVLGDSGFQPAESISHFGILAAFLLYFWPAGFVQAIGNSCTLQSACDKSISGATAKFNVRAIASAVTPVFMKSFRILG